VTEQWLWPSSRGDRVRTRLALPPGAGPHPVVVYLPADGDAGGADANQAVARFGVVTAVACLDLPLCGSRHSEKLSDRAFDPADCLHARLYPDAERQLASDLDAVLGRLAGFAELDLKRTALVARGRGAALTGGRPEGDPRFLTAVRREGEASASWLDEVAETLRRTLR
jgi:hypothetical protein